MMKTRMHSSQRKPPIIVCPAVKVWHLVHAAFSTELWLIQPFSGSVVTWKEKL